MRTTRTIGEKIQLPSIWIDGIEVKTGDRVRLRPAKMLDMVDIVLIGKTGIVKSIEQDTDEKIQISVQLEGGSSWLPGELQHSTSPFFFSLNEIEPMEADRSLDLMRHFYP